MNFKGHFDFATYSFFHIFCNIWENLYVYTYNYQTNTNTIVVGFTCSIYIANSGFNLVTASSLPNCLCLIYMVLLINSVEFVRMFAVCLKIEILVLFYINYLTSVYCHMIKNLQCISILTIMSTI